MRGHNHLECLKHWLYFPLVDWGYNFYHKRFCHRQLFCCCYQRKWLYRHRRNICGPYQYGSGCESWFRCFSMWRYCNVGCRKSWIKLSLVKWCHHPNGFHNLQCHCFCFGNQWLWNNSLFTGCNQHQYISGGESWPSGNQLHTCCVGCGQYGFHL